MAENKSCCMINYPTTNYCIGYAYVPIQNLDKTYSMCEALKYGTLFPELNLSINEYGKVCKDEGGVIDG